MLRHAAPRHAALRCAALAQVKEVSRRLLALHHLLGAREDLDLAWMVVREPGLLSADFRRCSWLGCGVPGCGWEN